MEIAVRLGEGQRVEAEVKGQVIKTDQPAKHGGNGTAPAPFDLFLASIATCAGFYVLNFCRTRDIPTDGISLTTRTTRDEASRMISEIGIEIKLPPEFPEKFEKAVIRSAELCSVKKHMEKTPAFVTYVTR